MITIMLKNFLPIANSILNKGKSAILPLFDTEVLSSESVSKNSYLGDSGISLYVFPSRANLIGTGVFM